MASMHAPSLNVAKRFANSNNTHSHLQIWHRQHRLHALALCHPASQPYCRSRIVRHCALAGWASPPGAVALPTSTGIGNRMFNNNPLASALLTAAIAPLAAPVFAESTTAPDSAAPDTSVAATTLPTVHVSAEADRRRDFQSDRSSVGAKVPAQLRDIPQAAVVVPKAVLESQAATSFADALRNVPGITIGRAEGGQIGVASPRAPTSISTAFAIVASTIATPSIRNRSTCCTGRRRSISGADPREA
jgi:TonB-dependent Receptor Plug Domain